MVFNADRIEGREIDRGRRDRRRRLRKVWTPTAWVASMWLLVAAAGGWPGEAFAQSDERKYIPVPAPHSQYAVKFVCGQTGPGAPVLVVRGQYLTAVNIHNPANEIVEYRFKTAQAQLAADGPISPFTYGTTGPDGAQVFVCGRHIVAAPGLTDGFFVIESRLPLDVTAVYTAGDLNAGVSSIHVDKIDARAVPNLCRQNVYIDLSNPANWTIATGGTAVQVPAGTIGAWDPNRTWMSYLATGTPSGATFTYRLDFCSCSSQGGTVTGDVKSDNTSGGTFAPPGAAATFGFTVGGTGNFGGSQLAVPIVPTAAQNFTGGGTGSIVATVQNQGGPTGVSFLGAVNLKYGYPGRCQ